MSLIKKIASSAASGSVWILHCGCGVCGACPEEIVGGLSISESRFVLVSDRCHADVLLVSGHVSKAEAARLKKIYDGMPSPKFIVAAGDCACSSLRADCSFSSLVPAENFVRGCPARTGDIISCLKKKYSFQKSKGEDHAG